MSIEQRLEQVERQTKRLRMAVVVLVATLCGVVSMAAIQWKGEFRQLWSDTLKVNTWMRTKAVLVTNAEGHHVIHLGSDEHGNGTITLYLNDGEKAVTIGAEELEGMIELRKKNGTWRAE